MTALAANNETISARFYPGSVRTDYPVAAAVNCFQGALMVLNASGFAEPGTTATTLQAIGRCRVQADNSSGSAGDITVTVDSGIFLYANDDGIAQADTGTIVYIVDDSSVSNDATGKSAAGSVFEVTSNGVFVSMLYPALASGS